MDMLTTRKIALRNARQGKRRADRLLENRKAKAAQVATDLDKHETASENLARLEREDTKARGAARLGLPDADSNARTAKLISLRKQNDDDAEEREALRAANFLVRTSVANAEVKKREADRLLSGARKALKLDYLRLRAQQRRENIAALFEKLLRDELADLAAIEAELPEPPELMGTRQRTETEKYIESLTSLNRLRPPEARFPCFPKWLRETQRGYARLRPQDIPGFEQAHAAVEAELTRLLDTDAEESA